MNILENDNDNSVMLQQKNIVKPEVVPFCLRRTGTNVGQAIIIETKIYICPDGARVTCEDGYEVDDESIVTSCKWNKETPPPLPVPPTPVCRPDIAKIVDIKKCQPHEVTKEVCVDEIPCNRDGENCLCPEEVEVKEIICSGHRKVEEDIRGELNCGEYGAAYQLSCPENYILNPITQLCELEIIV